MEEKSILRTFLPLGLVSFGGPTGQIGLMERVFVEKLRVVSADKFAEQLAVCMAIPGSTSLQMAMSMGVAMSGGTGLAAGLLYSLPGLVLMLLVGKYVHVGEYMATVVKPEWLYAAAVSILIVASLTMFQRTCKTTLAVIISVLSAAVTLSIPYQYIPLVPVTAAVVAGFLTNQATVASLGLASRLTVGGATGIKEGGFSVRGAQVALGLLVSLGIGAYMLGRDSALVNFFLAGASVGGGGMGVLPYLGDVIGKESDLFLFLFSVAIVSPGPIYNVAAAVGVLMSQGSLLYGLAVWSAVVLPGVLLLNIIAPMWSTLKQNYEPLTRAIIGLNAAAVGVLIAGTIELVIATIGLQWMRIFAVLIAVALQAVWEVEPVFVVLLGLATSVVHGILLL